MKKIDVVELINVLVWFKFSFSLEQQKFTTRQLKVYTNTHTVFFTEQLQDQVENTFFKWQFEKNVFNRHEHDLILKS